MKKITFIILALAGLFMSSCHHPGIGYLETSNAGYSVDTLAILRYSSFEERIQELTHMMENYVPEIQALIDELPILQATVEENEIRYSELDDASYFASEDFLNYIYSDPTYALEDWLYTEAYDWIMLSIPEREPTSFPDATLESLFRAYADNLYAYNDFQDNVLSPSRDAVEECQLNLETLCAEKGVLTPEVAQAEIDGLIASREELIPWTTATIEQLLGTEPLQYSLHSVRSDQGEEAAADFAKYITVIGGGRMYIDPQVDSPIGRYYISLKVKNEGHTDILTDVFTFVLQGVKI